MLFVFPLRIIVNLFRKIKICRHHMIRNPREKAWKECCQDPPGQVVRFKCCHCGKRKDFF